MQLLVVQLLFMLLQHICKSYIYRYLLLLLLLAGVIIATENGKVITAVTIGGVELKLKPKLDEKLIFEADTITSGS